jgi:hypothetical protein
VDQENEVTALLARRVLGGFLGRSASTEEAFSSGSVSTQTIVGGLVAARAELGQALDGLTGPEGAVLADVLRERAPLALLGDCWLDTVSQPATQPAPIVNRLFLQHFANRGRGDHCNDQAYRRRRVLEEHGVVLPHIMATDFLERAGARPVTAWHGAFYLALSRLAASFLPELIGVHCAHHLLGVDDRMLGTVPAVADPDVIALLDEFLSVAADMSDGRVLTARLLDGLRVGIALEREHVGVLGQLAERIGTMSLDAQVAAIIARHAPYAGRQHRSVMVGGQLLTEALDPTNFDSMAFMRRLRSSRQVKPMRGGEARFLRAIKFGGPMFGIFNEAEAAVFRRWVAAVQAGEQPDPDSPADAVGQVEACAWQDAVLTRTPNDVMYAAIGPLDDRALLHRLINIERYPNTLPTARAYAENILAKAEVLFERGTAGTYTDATYFDYSSKALYDRVERIYWEKLVNPYEPLTAIPDVDEVVFGQKTYAMGSLIDGAWAHRIGNVGRCDRASDQMLLSIYADEMGRGELRKNHITLIYRALESMSIRLPHISDPAFSDQAELPDSLYGFSLYQLSLALFPDSLHEEILGYNLGIEMYGLGEQRLHEIQKLRHHGFDVCYEEAHLSIDNLSAGHARQSAEIIVNHLDAVQRVAGRAAVEEQWRRVWRGYASFAYFVEHRLVRSLGPTSTAPSKAATCYDDLGELTI